MALAQTNTAETTQAVDTDRIHEVPPPQPLVKQRMSLYDVTLESMKIEDALVASEGELSPELEARFDELLAKGPEAVDAAAGVVKELTASQLASKVEKDRQQAREKAFESNAKKLKNRIRIAVDTAFNGKLKTKRFNLFTSKGRTATKVLLEVEGLEVTDAAGTQEALSHLHNSRPDLVKEVVTTTHALDEDVIMAIWNEEAPLRQAYFDAMSEWRGLLEAAKGDDELYERVVAREPVQPESKLPKVIVVQMTEGDRSLTIK